MSLAQVLYPAPTPQGLEEWFQAHSQHHNAIITAYKSKGIVLADLGLYPVNQSDLSDWLQRHQQMHFAMGNVSGVQGTDLTGLDLKKQSQADQWFFQHFLQHQGVAEASGQPI